jgi:predicted HicB family RNase H-like nuclease
MKKVKAGGISNAVQRVSAQVEPNKSAASRRRVRESSGEMLKRLNIELPEDVHKELKIEAVMKGVSMRQLVEEMLRARYQS